MAKSFSYTFILQVLLDLHYSNCTANTIVLENELALGDFVHSLI